MIKSLSRLDNYHTAISRYRIILFVVALYAVAGIIFVVMSRAATPFVSDEPETGQVSAPATISSDTTASGGQAVQFSASQTLPPTPAVYTVSFDGNSFLPSTITIKSGDTVKFVNSTSGLDLWPASDPHPAHTDYPGLDALAGVSPGGAWSFNFTKVGSWGYHDHLKAGVKGTVIVN